MNWQSQYTGVFIGIVLIALFMLVFIFFVLTGWPGGPDACLIERNDVLIDGCYCEHLRSGAIKQLANTWSNLGFVIIGLSLLFVVGNDGRIGRTDNAMLRGRWISILFGCVIITMGPGSMYFHASMVDWAGFIDSTSMFLLLAFIVGYNIYQATLSKLFSWLSWVIGLVLMTLALFLVVEFSDIAAFVFIGFAVLTALFDLAVHLMTGIKRSWKWYLTFIGIFSVAIVVWVFSATDKPLCLEDAVFLQGHAWWHLLSATAMVFLYLYYRSEKGGRPA